MPDKDNFNCIIQHSIVRRLTPIECARLQGLPDWWCDDISICTPSDSDISLWREIFEIHRLITDNSKKPKTDKQITKWLQNPRSDASEYKMYGNGMALPNVLFVFEGVRRILLDRHLTQLLEAD